MDFLEAKIEKIKSEFSNCSSSEMKYHKIIALGRNLGKLSEDKKNGKTAVQGCQSSVFLFSYMKEEKIYFEVEADALISAGLAYLLSFVYNGETPETILKSKPSYLEELGIPGSLTMNRANGLYSIYLKMQQDALSFLKTLKP